jgi:drug/metabolite transporter (DMT)-like permease
VPKHRIDDRSDSIAAGIACGIAAALFWAAGFAGIRHGLNAGFAPDDLVVHRFLWSGLAFLPFVLRGGVANFNGIGWGRGMVLAVLGGPPFALLSYLGFTLVPLGHGGVIQPSCAAVGGMLLATLLLGERLAPRRAVGALVIVAGLLVIGAEALSSIGRHGIVGDLAFVLTGLMFASFGTLLRLWGLAPLPATMAVSVLALVPMPLIVLTGGLDRMLPLGWKENLVQALLQGVLAGPGAVYLFARSVQLLGAGRAAVFPTLVPPFVLLLGWLVLGETPTALQLAGLVIVLVGFRLAQSTN